MHFGVVFFLNIIFSINMYIYANQYFASQQHIFNETNLIVELIFLSFFFLWTLCPENVTQAHKSPSFKCFMIPKQFHDAIYDIWKISDNKYEPFFLNVLWWWSLDMQYE